MVRHPLRDIGADARPNWEERATSSFTPYNRSSRHQSASRCTAPEALGIGHATSASAGCGHAAVHALVGSGPEPASHAAKKVAGSWPPGEMQPVPMRP